MSAEFPFQEGELSRLLSAARLGDLAALENLLATLYPALRRYALRRCNYSAEPEVLAKELAQSALIRISSEVKRCRATSDAQLIAWALTIVRNLGLDHYRSTERSMTVRLVAGFEHLTLTTATSARSASYSRGMRILVRLVRQAQRQLPVPTQRLVKLRSQRVTWREIAAELGTSPAAAKRRFQRAQQALRKAMVRRIRLLPPRQRREVERLIQ